MWVYVYAPDQGHIYTTGDTGGVQNERDRDGEVKIVFIIARKEIM